MVDIRAAELRQALSRFATGITVVTVQQGHEVHAMTVNSFTSVSLRPPLVLVCLAKESRTLSLMRQSGAFAISILSAEQEELADTFAGRPLSHQADVHFAPFHGGPRLLGALACIGCSLDLMQELGDHVAAVGRVTAVMQGEGKPLIFWRSHYARLRADEPLLSAPAVRLGAGIDLPYYEPGEADSE